MKCWCLTSIIAVAATVDDKVVVPLHDACTLLHMTSFCGEDGNCENLLHGETLDTFVVSESAAASPTPPISCIEAYIISSRDVVVESTTPPMVVPVTNPEWLDALHIHDGVLRRETELAWPSSIDPPNEIFVELCGLLSQMYEKINHEYPYILSEPDLFTDILTAAEKFEEAIIAPSRRYSLTAVTLIYHRYFANLMSVRGINTYIRMITSHIYSLPHGDNNGTVSSLRNATFRHFVPFLHLWHRVLNHVGLPRVSANYEFLESATKFEPAYLADNPVKFIWYIQVHPGFGRHRNRVNPPLPVLHETTQYDQDTFPLSILDALRLDGIVTANEADGTFQLQTLRAFDFLQTLGKNLVILQDQMNTVRSIIFFIQHYHPSGIRGGIREFCEQTKSAWLGLISRISALMKLSEHTGGPQGYPELIDLVWLCARENPEYFPLEFRVNALLPVLTGVRFRPRRKSVLVFRPSEDTRNWFKDAVGFFLDIPAHMFQHRFIIITHQSFAFYADQSDYQFLHQFVSAAEDQTEDFDRVKRALGIVIAVLVVDGEYLLPVPSASSSPQVRRNIYLNSESVRNGFCKVLNCSIFDTLFADYDISQVLDLMSMYKPLQESPGASL